MELGCGSGSSAGRGSTVAPAEVVKQAARDLQTLLGNGFEHVFVGSVLKAARV
jgi:hypothetical protein